MKQRAWAFMGGAVLGGLLYWLPGLAVLPVLAIVPVVAVLTREKRKA